MKMMGKETIKKYCFPVAAIMFLVVILELFVFNFRHFEMIMNKPIMIDNWVASPNTSYSDFNAFKVENTDSETFIEITDIDVPLNLIYFDVLDVVRGETAVFEQKYQLELTDQGNAIPYRLPQRSFFRMETKTHYTTVNPYGNAHSIRLYFKDTYEGEVLRVTALLLNPKYELLISKKRMLTLFFIFVLLYLIRPRSPLYNISVTDKFKWKKCIIIAVFCIESILFYNVTQLNTYFDNVPEGGNTQFMQLTEAIVDRGEVFLAAKAPDGMAEMEDPYDAVLRRSLYGEDSDVGDMSDTGFYQGRYFVYFGVAPILLFYVPYYAITGTHVMTKHVVLIVFILICAAVLLLLYELCKRYFERLPFILYIMSSVLFTFGAGQLFLAINPDFYSLPIIFALMCTLFGLSLWLKALAEIEKKAERNRIASCAFFAVGSLLMALPAASRPQFLIASFLSIILFWDAVFKERTFLSKKSIGESIAFMLPYVIIACGVMYYNYIRFHNVFDFGANYNLCYNNMPYRGFHIDRLFNATIGYLFYPCTVTNEFPFFQVSNYVSRYTGITADETLFGGIIYNNIYLAIVFFIFAIKKIIQKREAFILALVCPIFSMIVAIVDANMAGVLPRYYADFTWGFMISAFILFGYLYMSGGIGILKTDINLSDETKNQLRERTQYIIRCIFFVLFVITLIRLFLMVFHGNDIHYNNIKVFFKFKNLIEFWN